MFRLFGITLLLLTLTPRAGSALWSVETRLQGVVDLEPGNDYLTGFNVGFSDARLFRHRLEFQAAYLTSRPEAAFRNVLRQDAFLFSPTWHFRPKRLLDPTLQLDFGYQRYDLESKIFEGYLQNSTWLYGFKAGIRLNFKGRYSLRYALGYQHAASFSSLVYPLPFNLGVAVSFP